MKLKSLIPEKVSDTLKEMYPLVSKMTVTRLPIYQQVGRVESMKQSKKTVMLAGIGEPGGYIIELKRAVRVSWKGKTPVALSSKKARWEVVEFKILK